MLIRQGRIETLLEAPELSSVPVGVPAVDLDGATVVPGFNDSHLHLFWFGRLLTMQVDLVGCASLDELLSRLAQRAAESPGWIVGHGFDQDKLSERRFPRRDDLDKVVADRPILITRVCGHAAVVNSAVLRLLGAAELAAGDVESGLFTEDAIGPIYRRIPPLTDAQAEQAVLAACQVALAGGITTVQTMLDEPSQLRAFARLHRRGKLPVRVVGMPPGASVSILHEHGILSGFGDDRLSVGAVKFFSDGSLGARTAWLSAPYADDPSTRGTRIYAPEELTRLCVDAHRRGFQIAVHAIGDQALRETLDALEAALNGESNHHYRHRVEHASLCPPDCMERMARLGIVATLQPQFVTSDTWTGERIGPDRLPWAYPFKAMIQAGVPVSLSSDCPVERLDGFACISSAMGRHEWSPEGGLSFDEALEAYCAGSAYAALRESRLGRLKPGHWADFVVLDRDPQGLGAAEVANLRPRAVFVAGQCVHGAVAAPESPPS